MPPVPQPHMKTLSPGPPHGFVLLRFSMVLTTVLLRGSFFNSFSILVLAWNDSRAALSTVFQRFCFGGWPSRTLLYSSYASLRPRSACSLLRADTTRRCLDFALGRGRVDSFSLHLPYLLLQSSESPRRDSTAINVVVPETSLRSLHERSGLGRRRTWYLWS